MPGRNCHRLERAGRAAALVDGEACFAAIAEACERAQRSILIVGWDIHSRIRLRRDGRRRELPDELGPFLDAVLARRRELHAHVLDWDFAMIFALEREPLPLLRLGWRSHRRLHFALDAHHPPGASQHQKVIVVDDAIAFVGGLDLAACRWDTREHRPQDSRRVDEGYGRYPPFHDVQMAVDGAAAAALGDLVRDRWLRATGERLEPPRVASDPWPPGLAPHFRDVEVAIARTDPAWEGRPQVSEVEALHLDAIAAARRSIYLETQYLTSASVGEALAARLAEAEGPDVVIVVPRTASGWLEESTMGVFRARILRRLRAADRDGRLRVYYPTIPGLPPDARLNVHSKVLVVDDRLLRIGSANVSNRSMRFDSECDLAIEADTDGPIAAGIAGVRDDLLAEHLGVRAADVAAAVATAGSLGRAVDALRGRPRTLLPLPVDVPPWLDDLVPDAPVLDPERPVDIDGLVNEVLLGDRPHTRRHPVRYVVAALLALVVTGVVWRWTPLAGQLHSLSEMLAPHASEPIAVPAVLGAFAVASLLRVPVTALMVLSALILGPGLGFFYAVCGALASAALAYGAGRVLPRETVRRLAGRRLNVLSGRLMRRGALAIARLRLSPNAPFVAVSLIAGAMHVRPRDFFGGTLLVVAPGAFLLSVFGDRLKEVFSAPDGHGFQALLGVAAVVALLLTTTWLKRHLPVRTPAGV